MSEHQGVPSRAVAITEMFDLQGAIVISAETHPHHPDKMGMSKMRIESYGKSMKMDLALAILARTVATMMKKLPGVTDLHVEEPEDGDDAIDDQDRRDP